jgi:hypothetical protein
VRIEARLGLVGLADPPDGIEAGHVRRIEEDDQDVGVTVATEPQRIDARRTPK